MVVLIAFTPASVVGVGHGASVTIVAERGVGDGYPAATVPVGRVTALATNAAGNLYIGLQSSVRRVDPGGTIATLIGRLSAGRQSDEGASTEALIGRVAAIAVGQNGAVLVADDSQHRVHAVWPDGTATTIVGNGQQGYSGDGGQAVEASLNIPQGLAVDAQSNIYIADHGNNRIRKVTPDGIITTIAGTGDPGTRGDGGPATAAQLERPVDVAVDASLYRPAGIALAPDGGLYIADSGNNRVRRVDAAGVITTVAGTGGDSFGGDGGPAEAATLDRPTAVALGGDGSLYVADYGHLRIRKIDTAGIIATIAGNGGEGNAPEGTAAVGASLGYPDGIALRSDGTLLIAVSAAHRVKEVRPDGTLWTVAGNGTEGFAGDGGAASAAHLASPRALGTLPNGEIWIADTGNARMRSIRQGTIDTILATGATPDSPDEALMSSVAAGPRGGIRVTPDGTAVSTHHRSQSSVATAHAKSRLSFRGASSQGLLSIPRAVSGPPIE